MKAKIELLVDVPDAKSRGEAWKLTAVFPGTIWVAMDEKKMTVVGDGLDPVRLVRILRKRWKTELFSISPARKQDNDSYDRSGGGGGGGGAGGGGRRGESGGGEGGDSDSNNSYQDSSQGSGAYNNSGSLFFNLTDYDNWRKNARRVKILVLFSLLCDFQLKRSVSLKACLGGKNGKTDKIQFFEAFS